MNTTRLTNTKRSALALLADCSNADDFSLALQAVGRAMLRILHAGKLIDDERRLTKRGRDALAAPRMAQMEYDWLCYIEGGTEDWPRHSRDGAQPPPSPMYTLLFNRGWVEPTTAGLTRLTPAGRIALNNIRAARGSPNWKDYEVNQPFTSETQS